MKECNLICGSFLTLQDGDCDGELFNEAEAHFESCPQCRDDFAWYDLTVKAVSGMERVEPPQDFLRQLNHRLDKLGSPSYWDHVRDFFSFNAPNIPVPVGACALVVCALLAVVLYNQGPPLNANLLWSNVPSEHTTGNVVAPGLGKHTEPRHAMDKSLTSPHAPTEPGVFAKAMIPKKQLPGTEKTFSNAVNRPTIADMVGADNLTVESLTAGNAVASLKRTLAKINGRVLREEVNPTAGDILLGVAIPSAAYGEMNTELINHGAVISGAGNDVHPPTKDNDFVKVYIRFTSPPQ